VTSCTGTEIEKQLGLWERRVKGLRRMLLGWDQARPPDPPNAVSVDVIGLNSVQVRAQEPTNGPICTKFKGESNKHTQFHTFSCC
jgi:ankyrin repeat and fibronectin type-III domain-containing protein 1